MSSGTTTTISGQRFVFGLVTVIVLLLTFAFAGWFWSKANPDKLPKTERQRLEDADRGRK